ncbi:hypothetical protein ACJ41O_011623 [Fusarium nematophilum]
MPFHSFNKLPTELREMIWHLTLPDQDSGSIYPFSWRWYFPRLKPSPHFPGFENLRRRPPRIQVPMPEVFFVSRESRKVASRWLASHEHLSMHFREETQGHILVRDMDPHRDALYVPREAWEHFQDLLPRADDRLGDDETEEEADERLFGSIRKLALPSFTAYYSISTLAVMLERMHNLEAIYVVWDTLPKIRKSCSGGNTLGRALLGDNYTEEAGPKVGNEVAEVQPRWEAAGFPDLDEEVRMHHPDPDGEDFVEVGELQEWVDEMDSMWMTTEVEGDLVDDEGKLKVPRIHVRVREVC